ncbi:hypothetical protein ABZX77_30405 [Streptomyces sp. NPDC004237]|uniref:hypothetical protein n=1 Tax=Streptomyces sp. NPDC004237 TaxID=3154455 RepID=UPI0033ABD0FF
MTRLRYNVRETLHYGRPAVTYEVKTGRNGCKKAFELTVEATARSIHDTWPLRREIARHAGVDPDLVMPDWDGDTARRSLGRFAPHLWYVQLPEPAPAECLSCGHGPHASGTECEAIVDHGPRRWHRCLCLAAPGASTACPPQMNCQGGPLSFADVWSLRQGRGLRGVDGELITPAVLAEPPPGAEARKP